MTEDGTMERLVGRLTEAADLLRGGELTPEQAAEVVEQCAQNAANASAELDRLARAAAGD